MQRGLDCAEQTADMGEIQGQMLSYFVKSPPRAEVKPLAVRLVHNPNLAYYNRGSDCNAVLVGSVLAEPLKLRFLTDPDAGSDIISLRCKAHPQNPAQTIVTFAENRGNGAIAK